MKAERFVRFAAIQEHRMMKAALRVVTEDELNRSLLGKTSTTQIETFYSEIKPEFKETVCRKCNTTRIKASWDIDVASMAEKVGEPFKRMFMVCYTFPTMSIHATLASTLDYSNEPVTLSRPDISLVAALDLWITVVRELSQLYSLNLDQSLEPVVEKFTEMWGPL